VLVAVVAGVATVMLASWLFARPSDAPARAPDNGHISAGAGDLAVLDGATLRVGEHVVVLEGILAPARGSVCHGDRRTELDCGAAAANALASLVRARSVDCAITSHDARGRPVGDCVVVGKKLSATLVWDGWARAQADDLREAEAAARASGRGIWHPAS
jgi:endonuclease YncB( thermonuclease family)